MGKDKSKKQKKASRKIQDLPMKGKRAAGVKGGLGGSHGDDTPTESITLNRQ